MSNKFQRFVESAGDVGIGIAKGAGRLGLGVGDALSKGNVTKYLVKEGEQEAWNSGMSYAIGHGVGSIMKTTADMAEDAANGAATIGRNLIDRKNSPILRNKFLFKEHSYGMQHLLGVEMQPWISAPLIAAGVVGGAIVMDRKTNDEFAKAGAQQIEPGFMQYDRGIQPLPDDLNSMGLVQSLHNKYGR